MNNGWMNMTEAAKYLGISRRTIYRWIDKGIIKVYEIGPGVKRIKKEDLDRILSGEMAREGEGA